MLRSRSPRRNVAFFSESPSDEHKKSNKRILKEKQVNFDKVLDRKNTMFVRNGSHPPHHMMHNICAQKFCRTKNEAWRKEEKNMNKEGVYIAWDECKLNHATALVIGPEASAYAHGFFFFDVAFPADYPQSPPKLLMQVFLCVSVFC